jgi:putative transcriptional regulator
MKRPDKYQRLRVLRAERKWTQARLARKARMAQSRISVIENSKDDPTEDERESIAKAFQLPASDVFPEQVTA